MAKKKSSKKSKPPKKRPVQPKTKTVKVEDFQAIYSSDVATVWIDRTEVMVRSSPEIVFMRFETAVFGPNIRQEVCRLSMSRKHAESIVDILVSSLNYTPKEQRFPKGKKK
ncbi:MAG: hypothetical protein IIB99_05760 [Planctomycetes bacterium]|nr:hypothetical protein [Planctomycetota bacterium]